MNDWLADWTNRYETASSLEENLLHVELVDMLIRHPSWDGRQITPPTPSSSSSTGPSAASSRGMGSGDVEQSVYRGMGNGTSDVEQWRPLVAGHFPPEQVENALCVIRSESGGNSQARNPNSTASGIFQVMASVWAPFFGFTYAELYEPEKNAYAAAAIWRGEGGSGGGWQPWSPRTRRNCGL